MKNSGMDMGDREMTPSEETNERNACDEYFHEHKPLSIQDVWMERARRAEADARDAARYRWLRDKAMRVDFDGGNSGYWEIRGIAAYETWIGNRFDHRTFEGAVDAAMKERK